MDLRTRLQHCLEKLKAEVASLRNLGEDRYSAVSGVSRVSWLAQAQALEWAIGQIEAAIEK